MNKNEDFKEIAAMFAEVLCDDTIQYENFKSF